MKKEFNGSMINKATELESYEAFKLALKSGKSVIGCRQEEDGLSIHDIRLLRNGILYQLCVDGNDQVQIVKAEPFEPGVEVMIWHAQETFLADTGGMINLVLMSKRIFGPQ